MNNISYDRNGTATFAKRVQKNLEFIVASAAAGQDVHPVTQAVSSLLGIIVFPWERSAFDIMKRQKLPVLTQKQGWPPWSMSGIRRVLEVGDLVHILRNAVAHGHIEFDSDSRDPSEVLVTFTNIPQGGGVADWQGKIRGDQLVAFCRCFTLGMKNLVD